MSLAPETVERILASIDEATEGIPAGREVETTDTNEDDTRTYTGAVRWWVREAKRLQTVVAEQKRQSDYLAFIVTKQAERFAEVEAEVARLKEAYELRGQVIYDDRIEYQKNRLRADRLAAEVESLKVRNDEFDRDNRRLAALVLELERASRNLLGECRTMFSLQSAKESDLDDAVAKVAAARAEGLIP